eukprot:TRINITY_DN6046_c0_g1_i4.p1 TRINITY_DN6046_c0_g1~~TRINITY_DN6046_c0_g1_i4.p1  ORF type:complete len:221 (+),score=51.51 TRINITY_DN6046_c0_g1_i4:83-745(+)
MLQQPPPPQCFIELLSPFTVDHVLGFVALTGTPTDWTNTLLTCKLLWSRGKPIFRAAWPRYQCRWDEQACDPSTVAFSEDGRTAVKTSSQSGYLYFTDGVGFTVNAERLRGWHSDPIEQIKSAAERHQWQAAVKAYEQGEHCRSNNLIVRQYVLGHIHGGAYLGVVGIRCSALGLKTVPTCASVMPLRHKPIIYEGWPYECTLRLRDSNMAATSMGKKKV